MLMTFAVTAKGRGESMSRLDEAIASVAYILDCLRAYRDIVNSGDCNRCDNKGCEWKPKVGELVRYNCPFFHGKEAGRNIPDKEKVVTALHLCTNIPQCCRGCTYDENSAQCISHLMEDALMLLEAERKE